MDLVPQKHPAGVLGLQKFANHSTRWRGLKIGSYPLAIRPFGLKVHPPAADNKV